MNETFEIKGIKFDFRNKYKYAEETESLKGVLPTLIPFLEDYLSQGDLIEPLKEKIKYSGNRVHFAITDPFTKRNVTHFGSVAFDNKKKDAIIILRLINGIDKSVMKFELMITMIHEIFHLFIEGEENVRRHVDEFVYSFNFEQKKKILRLLIGKDKLNEILNRVENPNKNQ